MYIRGIGMKKTVTFIVKATNNKNKILRCMASISRQKNDNYRVIALCSSEGAKKQIEKNYPDFMIIDIENAAAFTEKLGEAFSLVDTEYAMLVNYDEVLAPNAVNVILSKKKDVVVFGGAVLKNSRFVPRYSYPDGFTLAGYMKSGFSVWNNAIRTSIIKNNSLSLDALDYCTQAMFLLRSYFHAESFSVTDEVIAYREKQTAKTAITFGEFFENRKELESILKNFSERGMLDEKEQIVSDFVLAQLGEVYRESSFFKRMKKKRLIKKMLGI